MCVCGGGGGGEKDRIVLIQNPSSSGSQDMLKGFSIAKW